MKKTRFVHPFPNELSNIRAFRQRFRPGAYIIKKNNKIKYIGYSGNDVIKTMYRHFYPWTDQQYRVTYSKNDKDIKVRVIYTNKPEQAAKLEKALIAKYKPADNVNSSNNNLDANGSALISKYLNLTEEAPF